jgi:hypothetical protein
MESIFQLDSCSQSANHQSSREPFPISQPTIVNANHPNQRTCYTVRRLRSLEYTFGGWVLEMRSMDHCRTCACFWVVGVAEMWKVGQQNPAIFHALVTRAYIGICRKDLDAVHPLFWFVRWQKEREINDVNDRRSKKTCFVTEEYDFFFWELTFLVNLQDRRRYQFDVISSHLANYWRCEACGVNLIELLLSKRNQYIGHWLPNE